MLWHKESTSHRDVGIAGFLVIFSVGSLIALSLSRSDSDRRVVPVPNLRRLGGTMTIRRPLVPDEIRPGMFVTIANEPASLQEDDESWQFKGTPVVNKGSIGIKIVEEDDGRDQLRGRPLLVVAYEHPFVAGLTASTGERLVLDTREFAFIEVSREFAEFAVDEEVWRKRYPRLFDGMKIVEADTLPEGAMKVLLQRGEDIMGAASTVVDAEEFTDRVDPEQILSSDDDAEGDE